MTGPEYFTAVVARVPQLRRRDAVGAFGRSVLAQYWSGWIWSGVAHTPRERRWLCRFRAAGVLVRADRWQLHPKIIAAIARTEYVERLGEVAALRAYGPRPDPAELF